jgi:hypothetical protein
MEGWLVGIRETLNIFFSSLSQPQTLVLKYAFHTTEAGQIQRLLEKILKY